MQVEGLGPSAPAKGTALGTLNVFQVPGPVSGSAKGRRPIAVRTLGEIVDKQSDPDLLVIPALRSIKPPDLG